MAEEELACQPLPDAPSPPSADSVKPCDQLPTLQRNALRKIFDRPEFTPLEVAALGYRRLQQAESIGQKGLQAITLWLQRHGLELAPPEPVAGVRSGVPRKTRRTIESAVRLLRTHGYVVQALDDEATGTNEAR